jgi:hypothetical protein
MCTPDNEVYKLFESISKTVDFSDCKTPADVNRRLLAKIKELHSGAQSQKTDKSDNSGVE